MEDIAVRVENLGKLYRLGQRESYNTLCEAATNAALFPFRKISHSNVKPNEDKHLWALRNVSFEVKRGEVVGIIGPNGSGKSTLLKILSRITIPTEGHARIRGRVGSLLEVGTGFHPELTGRENIYLSGSILGMQSSEIKRKFEDIVNFSEIEKFIDTPVKRYSSGMYIRLAFAVAAHLDPEILVVDEVLAVGDAAFQKKCLGKMGSVSKEGRTVLFVSHNMTAIRNLCKRTIWLDKGTILQDGSTYAVTEAYLQKSLRAESISDINTLIKLLPPDPAFQLNSVKVCQKGKMTNIVLNGSPVDFEIRYTVLQRTTGLRIYFDLLDEDQNILIRTFQDDDADAIPTTEPGEYISAATIPANTLSPHEYEIRIRAGIFNVRSCTGDGVGIPLKVEYSSKVNRAYPQDAIRSKLQPIIPWQTKKVSA